MGEENFTRKMKKATKEIHAVSDALVNAKLAFALSDPSVWAEGLLVFYEIFRYLEEAMDRFKDNNIGELDINGMRRTRAFEEDLNFYLGSDWKKDYIPRESVAKYLQHMQMLESSDPDMLMAYIYHLYMGLLSGGQILAKKRAIYNKFSPGLGKKQLGNAVTSFDEFPITQIKKSLVQAMNNVAETLDEETKNKLIEESKMVFILNNELIHSVQGATQVFLRKLAYGAAVLGAVITIYCLWKRQ